MMKKITIISLILILLAFSVVPVMAAKGENNGHGNGQNQGQGNNGGDQDQQQDRDREQDKDQIKDKDKSSAPGSGGRGNHEHTRMRTPFYLQGTISALDAGTITVTLTHGNAKVKEYIGTDLVLQTNESTLIFQITQGDEISGTLGTDMSSSDDSDDDGEPSNRVPISFDQLEVGQKVAVHGNVVESGYAARLITVYIQKSIEP
jgi:hypothetical protein